MITDYTKKELYNKLKEHKKTNEEVPVFTRLLKKDLYELCIRFNLIKDSNKINTYRNLLLDEFKRELDKVIEELSNVNKRIERLEKYYDTELWVNNGWTKKRMTKRVNELKNYIDSGIISEKKKTLKYRIKRIEAKIRNK